MNNECFSSISNNHRMFVARLVNLHLLIGIQKVGGRGTIIVIYKSSNRQNICIFNSGYLVSGY